jgi:1-pyrroline-5-carboxylate dehydrogenase
MIGQSKNVHQAEIDSACEFIDFLRFNVEFMTEMYSEQPVSDNGIWNRVEYRPLEGFCFAVTPSTLQQFQETFLLVWQC